MTNFEMYEYTLKILRKDKKGAVTIEEFESLLKFRSQWLFKSLLPKDGANKVFVTALSPFLVMNDAASISSGLVEFSSALASPCAHVVSISYGASLASRIPVDIITVEELYERKTNAVTMPDADYPVAVLTALGAQIDGVSTSVNVDYYKTPTSPYMDYYITSALNYVYIPAKTGATTTIPALTTTRDGTYRGTQTTTYTSLTAELEWRDNEKLMLIEMILQDLGVALGDQGIIQSAILERNNTLVK